MTSPRVSPHSITTLSKPDEADRKSKREEKQKINEEHNKDKRKEVEERTRRDKVGHGQENTQRNKDMMREQERQKCLIRRSTGNRGHKRNL